MKPSKLGTNLRALLRIKLLVYVGVPEFPRNIALGGNIHEVQIKQVRQLVMNISRRYSIVNV